MRGVLRVDRVLADRCRCDGCYFLARTSSDRGTPMTTVCRLLDRTNFGLYRDAKHVATLRLAALDVIRDARTRLGGRS